MKYSILKIFVLMSLLATSCSKTDTPADARLPFVGQFKTQEHVVTYESVYSRTKRTVPAGIEIESKLVQGNTNQIQMNLNGLMEDILQEFTAESITIDFDAIPRAMISGSSFELPPTPFEVTLGNPENQPVHESNIKGNGTVQGNTILFEYEFSYDSHDVIITFTGEVELVKEN